MKILAIGNSFSMNTTQHFNTIARLLDIEATVINLYVPGCSLERHVNNYHTNALYEVQVDAITVDEIDLKNALNLDDYDIITLQQASDYSGIISSLDPYLRNLIETLRYYQKEAKVYYHQTWSYDQNSDHPAFINYNFDSKTMYQAILKVSKNVRDEHKLPLIKCGDALQKWRDARHNYTITKDGYHLQDGIPKVLAACVWVHTLAKKINTNDLEVIVNHFDLPQNLIHTFEFILKSLED